MQGVELGKPLTYDNTRHGFVRLMTWIHSLMVDYSCDNVVFGVEPTGHYWMNLAQFLRRKWIHVVLVNPLNVKKTKELEDNSPTKNDHKDARLIGLLVKDGRYSEPNIPEDIYVDLRVGMNERERLVSQIPGTPEMMSIPGVGLVTVAGFLAEVGDLSGYDSPRQIQKLAWLNLRENSSGKHKGQTKISKRGRPRLRALLFRGVIPLLEKNADFKELHRYYAKRSQNPLK